MKSECLRKQLLAYAIKYQGEYQLIKKAILNQEPYEDINYQLPYITILDDNYPYKLFDLKFPPYVLFYQGDLKLCNQKSVAIVGSRIVNEYGYKCSKIITSELAKRYVIVSGGAKGVDAIAHTFSIDSGSIAVLGCGININYPKENSVLLNELRKKGLVISEYPPNSKPYAYHFPWRNRIIAALGDSLIVTQAKKRSGSMISVNEALALNKNIYTIPHPIFDVYGEGCNQLIAQGANIILEMQDLCTL